MGKKKIIRRIKITDWNTKLNGHLDLGVERTSTVLLLRYL